MLAKKGFQSLKVVCLGSFPLKELDVMTLSQPIEVIESSNTVGRYWLSGGGLALLDLLPLCIIHFWNHWLKLDKMGVILTLN